MELADIIRNRLTEAEGRVSNLREQLAEAEQEAQSWRLVLPLEIQRKERRGSSPITVPPIVTEPETNGSRDADANGWGVTFEDKVVAALSQIDDVVTCGVLADSMGVHAHTVSAALSHLYGKGRVDRVAVDSENRVRGSRYAYLSKNGK